MLVNVIDENLRKALGINGLCVLYCEYSGFYRIIDQDGSLHDIDKEHAIKLYSESEYNAVHQELLQRREEVTELMRRVEQAEADKKRAVAAADRATEEVNRIASELDEAREAKKVPLPREVAEAIEKLGKRFSRKNILAILLKGHLTNDVYSGEYQREVSIIRDMEFDDILSALVNGYTVEEPDIRDEIRSICQDCSGNLTFLIERLTDLFQTRLEQEKAAQSG